MTVLLDSDIVIEILRQRNSAILSQWSELAGSNAEILTSPVTVAEIEAGARPTELKQISLFFSFLDCTPIDEQIGRLAGGLMRRYSRSHKLELADALIAATSIRRQASLWTRNRKHYPMIDLTFYS